MSELNHTKECDDRFVNWIMRHKVGTDLAMFALGVSGVNIGVVLAAEGNELPALPVVAAGAGFCYLAYELLKYDTTERP